MPILSQLAVTPVSHPHSPAHQDVSSDERKTSTVHDADCAAPPLPHHEHHDGQSEGIIGRASSGLARPIYTHSLLISGSLIHHPINHKKSGECPLFSPMTVARVAAKQPQPFCRTCRNPAMPSHVDEAGSCDKVLGHCRLRREPGRAAVKLSLPKMRGRTSVPSCMPAKASSWF